MADTFIPENESQTRDSVAWALNAGAGLRIQGHASKAGLGTPTTATHGIDLSRLDGIISYAPEELVLTAQAGAPIAEIDALLRQHRQHLAFEPPDWGPHFGADRNRGTLGGIISCNASGPRRFTAGAARDHFLGFSAINGRGEIFRAGGRVVKNVTGYDLPKLFAGAYGRLGILTEVTVKTLPAPMDSATLVLRDLDDAAALAQLRKAASGTLELSGLAHLPACIAGAAQTLFRLEGPIAAVTERHARLKQALQGIGSCQSLGAEAASGLWRQVRDADFFTDDAMPLWRISVPPQNGAAVAARIGSHKYYFDWAGGLIWLLSNDADRVQQAVAGTGGHAILFRAPDAMRRANPVFEPQPAALAALEERVRKAFDPAGIFNPPVA